MNRLLIVSILCGAFAVAQKTPKLPVATQTLLDGVASAESKGVIKSVLKIVCKRAGRKGTGFVVSGGEIITTNQHVVAGCDASELEGTSSASNEPVKFSKMTVDENRDLALLCAEQRLPFSLELNGDTNAPVETEVETWGYPLRHEGVDPILSRGYVAGYSTAQTPGGAPVKRLIVNGALNPGNSGGPLIDRKTGKVIGIVVEKWDLFSPNVESVINGLEHPGASMGGGAPIYVRYPDGQVKSVTQQEGTRVALKEIYEMSQVMIGEAISVSELNAFLNEKRSTFICGSR